MYSYSYYLLTQLRKLIVNAFYTTNTSVHVLKVFKPSLLLIKDDINSKRYVIMKGNVESQRECQKGRSSMIGTSGRMKFSAIMYRRAKVAIIFSKTVSV